MVAVLTVNVTDGDEPNTERSQVTLMLDDSSGLFTVMNFTIISTTELAGQQGEYNITVNAQDGGDPPQSTSAMFTIDVVNTNEHAPVFNTLDDISFTENENDTYTFTISDSDPDGEGLPMTPVITGQSAANFIISRGTTDEEFVLMPRVPLDREVEETLLLTLTVSDSGAAMFRRTASTNITITVEDVNDNPPVIENLNTGMRISVFEETASGHVVYQVSASDRDEEMNANLTFAIDSTDDFPFTIDTQSGNITTTRVINDSDGTDFSANVTVTDGGTPPLSDTVVIIIIIIETNNHRPIFGNLPTSVNISESLPVNNIIVQNFEVTDSDNGDAGTFRVELQQTDSFFRLDGDSVRLNQAVDHEVCKYSYGFLY